MVIAIAFLIIGLLLIWISSEVLIEFSVRLGVRLGISTLVVGVVIVGFGTSLPELSVSALAARDDLGLAVANIVGSNATNLSLALGLPVLVVGSLSLNSPSVKYLALISTASVGLLAIFVQGHFAVYEGIILLGLLPFALWALYSAGKLDISAISDPEKVLVSLPDAEHSWMEKTVDYLIGPSAMFKKESLSRMVTGVTLGLIGTVGGAQLLVSGVKRLATEVGLETGFLGLTLVAIGTSMPEIIVGVQSAKKGRVGLFAGNLLGSNVLHSLFVAGLIAIIGADTISDARFTTIVVPMMVGIAILGAIFIVTKTKITRWQAITLIVIWCGMIGVSASSASV